MAETNAKVLLSKLCDALDELETAEAKIEDWPFERPYPGTMLDEKKNALDRVNAARKECEWTVSNFRASARSEQANQRSKQN